jgi:hypothetical protein
VDVRGVLQEDETGTAGVVVGGPAKAARFVGLAEIPVGLPPDGTVAVDGAVAGDGDVVLVADVDEGGGPGHLDAGDAGGEFGIVFEIFRAEEGDAFGKVEGDVGLEEERAGEIAAGLESDGATFQGCGVDGPLDGDGVERGAVALGSVGVGEEGLWGGEGNDGNEGAEESQQCDAWKQRLPS